MAGHIALIPNDTSADLTLHPRYVDTILIQLDITRHGTTKHQKAASTTGDDLLPKT
jgi:hypothetical protein